MNLDGHERNAGRRMAMHGASALSFPLPCSSEKEKVRSPQRPDEPGSWLSMPQNEYIKESIKRFGRRFDHEERMRKKKAREPKKIAKTARKLRGIKAKLFTKKRYTEKATMKKTIKAHQEKDAKTKDADEVKPGAVPAYLLDREQVRRTKVLSNMIKQKRKEKAGKWQVPIPKVKAMTEDEMFKILRSGKRKKKAWKRVVNKVSFVGENFTRKPPKFERYIRPAALRFKKAHVTHPELKMTFCLDIVSVKKNPQSALYTSLGVITKGTIIEVNVSELGLVTQTGKVIWAKYAQVTNNPDIDGCINALLLV
ncbi:nsa2 [Symbiodinium sp. CCMP2592]|nr:nsa2 [Symbiodinium sp. CCMP2592]